MIQILIADDHLIFRKGLKATITDAVDMCVGGEASTGNEVLAKAAQHHYDLVILDITMPGLNGLEVLKQLKSDHPKLPVLILSMHPEDQYAIRALKAGASGYLTKDTDEKIMIDAVRKVCKGGKYITPSLAEKLACAIETDHEKSLHESLSDREFQVMRLLAGGMTTGQIAKELNLSVTTVSTYRYRILEKMGMNTNADITHYAITQGLME